MKKYTLTINDSIAKKVIDFLSLFSSEDLQIRSNNDSTDIIKAELLKDYNYINQKEAKFHSIDQLNEKLNRVIK